MIPNLTERAALDLYLRPPSLGGKLVGVSTFWAALRDARQATGRDPETGAIRDEDAQGSWLGAIGYLCLLDQIGSTVRRHGFQRRKGNRLGLALEQWSNCTTDERNALYALRCSFAHDYGLLNPSSDNTPELRHAFAVGRSGPLVQLPSTPWDGTSPAPLLDRTVINLKAVSAVVEDVQAEVQRAHDAGVLELALEGGVDEFQSRCLLWVHT